MFECQRGAASCQLAKWALPLFIALASPAFGANSNYRSISGTYGNWNKGCDNIKCEEKKFLMGGLVQEINGCVHLYWEQNINSGRAQYFSVGSQKGNNLYVSGDVYGEQCKAVFHIDNNVLSYVASESDDCMNNLGMGDYLSKFENVRVSREETPPRDADPSYRSAKWRGAWREASKQCPVTH